MLLRQLDLTTALRPSLLPEEILLFVQDAVGLYRDRYKLQEYQNGHAYLTSHRICYVDNAEARSRSVALDLKDVDHPELYVGDFSTVLEMCTDMAGRFLEIICKDLALS